MTDATCTYSALPALVLGRLGLALTLAVGRHVLRVRGVVDIVVNAWPLVLGRGEDGRHTEDLTTLKDGAAEGADTAATLSLLVRETGSVA